MKLFRNVTRVSGGEIRASRPLISARSSSGTSKPPSRSTAGIADGSLAHCTFAATSSSSSPCRRCIVASASSAGDHASREHEAKLGPNVISGVKELRDNVVWSQATVRLGLSACMPWLHGTAFLRPLAHGTMTPHSSSDLHAPNRPFPPLLPVGQQPARRPHPHALNLPVPVPPCHAGHMLLPILPSPCALFYPPCHAGYVPIPMRPILSSLPRRSCAQPHAPYSSYPASKVIRSCALSSSPPPCHAGHPQ